MGFYDNYNFDGLKLVSHLKDEDLNPEPCAEFLAVVEHLKTLGRKSISVAEIGIGYGATALQVLKMLDKNDFYFCFDFEVTLKNFMEDLDLLKELGIKCEIVALGNSDDEWDSYNFNLSNLFFQMRQQYMNGLFDAVYLDGAHTFMHDGLAVCLLKELLKDGGILILDGMYFTFTDSGNQELIANRLPPNQASDKQMLRVQEIFLTNDPNFERVSLPDAYRGIFRKRSRK